jgi:hypothetical protein
VVAAVQRRANDLRLAAGLTLVAVVLHVPGLIVRLFNADEASVAATAMALNRGAVLYHAIADRKPPVVPYLYAAIFKLTGTHDLRPVRLIAILTLVATALLLAREAERRYRTRAAGVWCAFLLLFGYALVFPRDSQAATFEIFMLLPMTAAVVAAGRGRAVQAGLLLALACLCKQTAATTLLPIAFLLVRSGGVRRVAVAITAAVALLVSVALAFGLGPFLLWTTTGNRGYLSLQGPLTNAVAAGALVTVLLLAFNAVLVWMCWRGWRTGVAATDAWLWLLAGAVASCAGFRFFGHYYLQLLPPAALIAAGVAPSLAETTKRVAVAGMALPAVVCVGAAFVPGGDTARLPVHAVAQRIDAVTTPEERIFVWGDFPELYWASSRAPATRFIHTGFLTGSSGGRPSGSGQAQDGVPGAWHMLRMDISAQLPSVIVDTTDAHVRQSEFYPLDATALWRNLRGNYRLASTVRGVRLYRLQQPPDVETLAGRSGPIRTLREPNVSP